MELCVKTAQPLPHFATEHQKRAGRLLDFAGLGKIQVETSIAAVYRIRRETAD